MPGRELVRQRERQSLFFRVELDRAFRERFVIDRGLVDFDLERR